MTSRATLTLCQSPRNARQVRLILSAQLAGVKGSRKGTLAIFFQSAPSTHHRNVARKP